jgi:hypothetical protein
MDTLHSTAAGWLRRIFACRRCTAGRQNRGRTQLATNVVIGARRWTLHAGRAPKTRSHHNATAPTSKSAKVTGNGRWCRVSGCGSRTCGQKDAHGRVGRRPSWERSGQGTRRGAEVGRAGVRGPRSAAAAERAPPGPLGSPGLPAHMEQRSPPPDCSASHIGRVHCDLAGAALVVLADADLAGGASGAQGVEGVAALVEVQCLDTPQKAPRIGSARAWNAFAGGRVASTTACYLGVWRRGPPEQRPPLPSPCAPVPGPAPLRPRNGALAPLNSPRPPAAAVPAPPLPPPPPLPAASCMLRAQRGPPVWPRPPNCHSGPTRARRRAETTPEGFI